MHATVKGASALILAGKATLKAGAGRVVEAVSRCTVSTTHGLGVCSTVATCLDLDVAGLAVARMTGVLTRVHAAIQLLAADVSARRAALVQSRETRLLARGLRATHRNRLGAAEALLGDGDSTWRTGTGMARISTAVSALAAAAALTAAVRVGSAAARWVLYASTPAPIDLGHIFACVLTAGASPCAATIANLGVLLHGVVLFGLLDTALGPFADAWKMQHRVALRARPGCLTSGDCTVADDAVVLSRGELCQQTGTQVGILDRLGGSRDLDEGFLGFAVVGWFGVVGRSLR